MNQVILDKDLRTKLKDLDHQITFLDENGKALGLFLPLDAYKKILSFLPIPYSEEELQRRRDEPGGTTLQEFWKSMGVE